MKNVLFALLHLAVMAAKLCGPGGVRAVIVENLMLKQQLIVLRRGRRRAPSLTLSDRLLCGFGSVFLTPGRIRKLAIAVRPSTLLAFHAALVRRKYRRLFSAQRCSQKPGPKGPSEALIQAIVELKSRNPRFGCPRIARIISHTFGVDIDKNVVSRVLSKHYRRAPGGAGPSWLSFIGHTTDSLWSVDLFGCESIVLRSYWVLVVMDQFTRRLVGFGVHCGAVTGGDVCHMFNAAIRGQGAPETSQYGPRSAVRSKPMDGKLADSGDRRSQNPGKRAAVTPHRGAFDWDNAARIPRPGAVLECR
jgi:transposase InsO family protein